MRNRCCLPCQWPRRPKIAHLWVRGGFSYVLVTCDMCYWLAALASGNARTVKTLRRCCGMLNPVYDLYMNLYIICSDQSSKSIIGMTSLSLPQDFLSSGILVKIMSATRSGPMYCNALPLSTLSTFEKCGPLQRKTHKSTRQNNETTTAWQMILGSSPQLVAFATQLCFDSDWSCF